MFSKLSLVAFLLCSIFNLHAAHAQLPFPDFRSGTHQYQIETNGSVHTDATVDGQLKKLHEMTYLIKIRPKVRGETDARWWMNRLLGKWKSQGFRSDWHLAVVCEDPPLVILHSPSQRRPGNVMDLLEAITSQGTYRETIKHKDELDTTVAGLKTRLAQTDKAAAELAKVQGITLQEPVDFVAVVQKVKDNCDAVLSKKLSEGEQKQSNLKYVIGLLAMLLLAVIVWAIVSAIKEKRRLKKTYFNLMEGYETTLSNMEKYEPSTETEKRKDALRSRIVTLKAAKAITPQWLTKFFETAQGITELDKQLRDLKGLDTNLERDYPFPVFERMIRNDREVVQQRGYLESDPVLFERELWLSLEEVYSRTGTAMNLLGEVRGQVLDGMLREHGTLTRTELAHRLMAEADARTRTTRR